MYMNDHGYILFMGMSPVKIIGNASVLIYSCLFNHLCDII